VAEHAWWSIGEGCWYASSATKTLTVGQPQDHAYSVEPRLSNDGDSVACYMPGGHAVSSMPDLLRRYFTPIRRASKNVGFTPIIFRTINRDELFKDNQANDATEQSALPTRDALLIAVYQHPTRGWVEIGAVGAHRQEMEAVLDVVDAAVHQIGWLQPWFGEVYSTRDGLGIRAQDVLTLLIKGHTRKSAATKLGISHHTVNDYCKEIFKTYGVNSTHELISKFIAQNAATP
jgi:DNA-binding CsgD family transcriptional regulator